MKLNNDELTSYDDQIKNNKTEKQKDRRTKRKDVKRGDGGVWEGAASLRFFDLLNSMIFDLKRSVDLRSLFDLVLHSSFDDLVWAGCSPFRLLCSSMNKNINWTNLALLYFKRNMILGYVSEIFFLWTLPSLLLLISEPNSVSLRHSSISSATPAHRWLDFSSIFHSNIVVYVSTQSTAKNNTAMCYLGTTCRFACDP